MLLEVVQCVPIYSMLVNGDVARCPCEQRKLESSLIGTPILDELYGILRRFREWIK